MLDRCEMRVGQLISSTSNPAVKSVARLHHLRDCEARREFLLEGTHALTEALAAHWKLRGVYFTQEWLDRNVECMKGIPNDVDSYQVSPEVLRKMVTTQNPDGVVAVAAFAKWDGRIPEFRLAIAVDALQDPGNLGTLVRASVACGADACFVGSNSVATYHPKVIRASAGQWFRQPPLSQPLGPLLDECKSRRVQVLAAAAGGQPIWDADLTRPTLILLGNEGAGLDPRWLERADSIVGVPMSANVESLNVAVTGAMMLYEAMRQQKNR
jgi:RNA methyltransferase, TrmH family